MKLRTVAAMVGLGAAGYFLGKAVSRLGARLQAARGPTPADLLAEQTKCEFLVGSDGGDPREFPAAARYRLPERPRQKPR